MVRMKGVNQGKNTCFSIIIFLSILKKILDERKKDHKRLVQLELYFLLPEHGIQEINKNDAVIVFSFIFWYL